MEGNGNGILVQWGVNEDGGPRAIKDKVVDSTQQL